MLKYSPGPPLWRQMMLLCVPLRERCSLAMGLTTRMGPSLHPAPFQLFVELLFSVLLLLPRLFGPENSWKYSCQTMLLLIQSMYLSLVLMHQVHINSSHPSCGRSLVLFQVLRGRYAYQTCKPSLAHLSVTNTSDKSLLSSNQKRIHLQARLLLSVHYHSLIPITPHLFR